MEELLKKLYEACENAKVDVEEWGNGDYHYPEEEQLYDEGYINALEYAIKIAEEVRK